jgi:hypothetical protein
MTPFLSFFLFPPSTSFYAESFYLLLFSRKSENLQVGFVDAEGQGDRDSAYDARIACPVNSTLLTHTVLWWIE